MAAIVVSQDNKATAMLVSQINPGGGARGEGEGRLEPYFKDWWKLSVGCCGYVIVRTRRFIFMSSLCKVWVMRQQHFFFFHQQVFLTYWCLEKLNFFLGRLATATVVIQKGTLRVFKREYSGKLCMDMEGFQTGYKINFPIKRCACKRPREVHHKVVKKWEVAP